jgi:hypothetical protein
MQELTKLQSKIGGTMIKFGSVPVLMLRQDYFCFFAQGEYGLRVVTTQDGATYPIYPKLIGNELVLSPKNKVLKQVEIVSSSASAIARKYWEICPEEKQHRPTPQWIVGFKNLPIMWRNWKYQMFDPRAAKSSQMFWDNFSEDYPRDLELYEKIRQISSCQN